MIVPLVVHKVTVSYLISGAMNQSPSNAQPSGAWKLSFGNGSC